MNPPDTSQFSLLSDLDILERLVADEPAKLFISPIIDLQDQLGPSSIDIRLGFELRVPQLIANTHIDLAAPPSQIDRLQKDYFNLQRVGPDETFVLHPGEFALASTLEYFRLPHDIAGRLEGRSSLGRLGLIVHATAGFVDPGFEGVLTFELANAGKLPVKLFPGLRLGQLCFFHINEVKMPYMAKKVTKYGKALTAGLSQITSDPEIRSKTEQEGQAES